MPIYEYQCTNCQHHFDLMQKYTDEPAKQCPKCFENTIVKLVSAAGFQLKGTGWYATDFKNKGSEVKESKDSNGSTKDASTSETASATKPEAVKDTTSVNSEKKVKTKKGDK